VAPGYSQVLVIVQEVLPRREPLVVRLPFAR
jgi:hypothetical protein